ncbi:MAG: hypothetical protein OXC00_10310, partial [Acidimicrobiaceae bacterium]|nr:hypothetical protein [Acidimicrobiaceae bacterium]
RGAAHRRRPARRAGWAAQAAPSDGEVHAARAEVYRIRRDGELSLMARGLYRDASRTSEALSERGQEPD